MAKKLYTKFTKESDRLKTLADPDYDKANGYNNEKSEDEYEIESKEKDKGKNKNKETINGDTTSDPLTPDEQRELTIQACLEYQYCKEASADWIERMYRIYKLYNNQKRDPSKVGDPLIFTVHQTVLASLYTDTLQVLFKGREEGDKNVASNLNGLSAFDFDLMDKDILDYEWDWDAGMAGRGLVEFTHFDRDSLTPIPEVLDPVTFLHDPRAKSVQGNRLGRGSMRFGGQEISMTKWDVMNNKAYFNVDKLKMSNGLFLVNDGNWQSMLDRAREARAEAQGTVNNPVKETDIGDNGQFDVLKWYTFFKGERCVVYLAQNKSTIIRYNILQDKEGVNLKYYPIFDRPLYPDAHTWNGTSIPDLIEDKQRLRSIIYNAMGDAVKADLYPMYLYNTQKIKNRADLDFAFNKHIPVDGDVSGAVTPVNKANINSVVADYILNSLDAAAQKATATPEIQQGAMSDTQRTLGETELIAQKSSTRYSLTAKVFGWSEKRLWNHWYFMYKNYWDKELDEKLIRVNGAYGDEYRKLTKDQIIAAVDPDVQVVSKAITEAQKIRDQMRFEKFVSIAIQEPTTNRRYAIKKLADLYNMKPDEIERLLPPTVDELQALAENTMLDNAKTKDDLPPVEDNQNHVVHIEMHSLAAETPAKKGHLLAHREALRLQRENPSLFPNADPNALAQAGITPTGGQMQNAAQGGGAAGISVPKMNLGAEQMTQAAGSQQQSMPKQGLT